MEATLLEEVPRECEVMQNEVFGPVLILERYAVFRDAINRFGLARSFRALKCGLLLRFGDAPGRQKSELPMMHPKRCNALETRQSQHNHIYASVQPTRIVYGIPMHASPTLS